MGKQSFFNLLISSVRNVFSQKKNNLPEKDFVVLDLETTGLSRTNDFIIEIAMNAYSGQTLVGQYHSYVNPGVHIPAAITRMTGISDSTVADAPSIQELKRDILAFIGWKPIVGHNIKAYDIPILENQLCKKISNKLYDTLHLAKKAFPGLPSYKLSFLNQVLHLGGQEHHRAASDIAVNIELFKACYSPEKYRPYLKDKEAISKIPIEKNSFYTRFNIHDFAPANPDKMPNTGLTGKTICFTGELSMLPEVAMQMAVDAGAELKSCVSWKLDYLVEGVQDRRLVGPSGISSKQQYAMELKEKGNTRLRVINESEFMELLKEK